MYEEDEPIAPCGDYRCTLCYSDPKDTMNYKPPRYLLLQINGDYTVTCIGSYEYHPDDEDVLNAIIDTDGHRFTLIDTQGCGSYVVGSYRIETAPRLVNLAYED
jgi:hypothetical protein